MFSGISAPPKKEEKRSDQSSTLRKSEELHVIVTIGSLRYDIESNPGVPGQCLWNILRRHMAGISDREAVLQRVATAAGVTFNELVDITAGIRSLFEQLNTIGYRVGYRLVNVDLSHPHESIENEGVTVTSGPILRLAVFGTGADGHYVEAINSDSLNTQIKKLTSPSTAEGARTTTSSQGRVTENASSVSISDEEKKERILRNYPPNLSVIQEIGFGVKVKDISGELIEQRVCPDVHFRGTDRKEYLVFYNNHLEQLRSLIYERLKKEIDDHDVVLSYDKNALLEKARTSTDKTNYDLPIQLKRLALNVLFWPPWFYHAPRKIISLTNSEVRDRARLLSTTCANLKHHREKYGDEVTPNRACAVVVDRGLNQFIALRETPNNCYKAVEEGFYGIMNSSESLRNKVLNMNKCLNEFVRIINPCASDQQAIDFCFPLNRANYYLSRLERDLQHKDLPTLEAMYELRKKINRLSLEFKFMFAEGTSPILGIGIDRCKIIVETEKMTMIFLERNETQKFQTELEKELDRKASNITGIYDFKPLTGPELRNLANELKPESYQGMLNIMDRKLVNMETQREIEKGRSIASFSKVTINVVGEGIKLALGAMPELNIQSVTIQDMKEYVATEKALKDAAVREEEDLMGHLHHSTFDSPTNKAVETPTNITVDTPKNITVDTPPTSTPSIGTRINTGFPQRTASVRRGENPTKLGRIVKDFNLEPSDIDGLLKSFEHFIESRRIEGQISIIRNQREYIQKIKENEEGFLNLFKLYIQMIRGNFPGRTDFGGTLIAEDREKEMRDVTADGRVERRNVNEREYIVREIQRLEDFI